MLGHPPKALHPAVNLRSTKPFFHPHPTVFAIYNETVPQNSGGNSSKENIMKNQLQEGVRRRRGRHGPGRHTRFPGRRIAVLL